MGFGKHNFKNYPNNGVCACQKCGFVTYAHLSGGYCGAPGLTREAERVLKLLEQSESPPKEPDCCKSIDLERMGTGANEVAAWGVYECKSCSQTWYCLAGFNEPWQKDLKLVGE